MIIYVDTSACLKRVLIEDESTALADYLDAAVVESDAVLVSATLTEVEAARRLIREGVVAAQALDAVADCLAGIHLIPVDRGIERAAMQLPGPGLRSLDALHLAAAQRVHATDVLTYDQRFAEAAQVQGLRVAAPA